MQPSAKIILDSISPDGVRLTTMEVVMHRFVLAEFNTHRVFSRNSASSRAIPIQKQIDKIKASPAYPIHWGKEQKGMQSGYEIEDTSYAGMVWTTASRRAMDAGAELSRLGLHKSLVNRLLEPFMWHTVIVTATEWDNFFWQRCHPDAQPEMKAAADAMQLAYYTAPPPQVLEYEQWHTPYIQEGDIPDIGEYVDALEDRKVNKITAAEIIRREVSTARCARVSYLTHDGHREIGMDLGLFERLRSSGHWSPFEHVATPSRRQHECGNFRGWKQFRKEFLDENRTAFVPNHPLILVKEVQSEKG